ACARYRGGPPKSSLSRAPPAAAPVTAGRGPPASLEAPERRRVDQVPVGGQVDRAARFGRQQGALVEPAAIAMGGGRVHDPARGAGRRRARRTPTPLEARGRAFTPSTLTAKPEDRSPPVRRARSGCASAA